MTPLTAADPESHSPDLVAENIAKLKELFPELRTLERQRINAWKSFDEKSRGVEEERDRIESEAARLLAHSISEELLFTITWHL